MGLDMYLSAKKYIQDWRHNYPNDVIPAGTPAKKIQKLAKLPFPVTHVEMEAAYWRKANAIHKWFVDHVQDGVDDCASYYVAPDQLRELLKLCEQVKADPVLAPQLLPTQAGFFFGGTKYDEDYMGDIDNTIEQLTTALEAADADAFLEFQYRSSW